MMEREKKGKKIREGQAVFEKSVPAADFWIIDNLSAGCEEKKKREKGGGKKKREKKKRKRGKQGRCKEFHWARIDLYHLLGFLSCPFFRRERGERGGEGGEKGGGSVPISFQRSDFRLASSSLKCHCRGKKGGGKKKRKEGGGQNSGIDLVILHFPPIPAEF